MIPGRRMRTKPASLSPYMSAGKSFPGRFLRRLLRLVRRHASPDSIRRKQSRRTSAAHASASSMEQHHPFVFHRPLQRVFPSAFSLDRKSPPFSERTLFLFLFPTRRHSLHDIANVRAKPWQNVVGICLEISQAPVDETKGCRPTAALLYGGASSKSSIFFVNSASRSSPMLSRETDGRKIMFLRPGSPGRKGPMFHIALAAEKRIHSSRFSSTSSSGWENTGHGWKPLRTDAIFRSPFLHIPFRRADLRGRAPLQPFPTGVIQQFRNGLCRFAFPYGSD